MRKKQVSVLIPIRNGKILALRRSDDVISYNGFWNFPGGAVDPGEFTAGAAIRELEEESGLIVSEDDISFLGEVEADNKIIYFYITTKAEGQVKINSESTEYAWMPIEGLSKHMYIPLDSETARS